MTKYDILYMCPLCESEHTTDEWNEATEEYFGGNIMPIEISPPEHQFICPTCSEVSGIEDLSEIEEE